MAYAEPSDEVGKRKTGFLDLPRELRDNIYELALCPPNHYLSFSRSMHNRACFAMCEPDFLRLRATSRQVAVEALETYFGNKKVSIEMQSCDEKPCGDSSECACDAALSVMRKIRLEARFEPWEVVLRIDLHLKGKVWQVSCACKDPGSVFFEDWEMLEVSTNLQSEIGRFLDERACRRDTGLRYDDLAKIKILVPEVAQRSSVEIYYPSY